MIGRNPERQTQERKWKMKRSEIGLTDRHIPACAAAASTARRPAPLLYASAAAAVAASDADASADADAVDSAPKKRRAYPSSEFFSIPLSPLLQMTIFVCSYGSHMTDQ